MDDSLLKQFGNQNLIDVNESYSITDEYPDLVKYLLEESHNIKDIANKFEVPLIGARLSVDRKNVVLTDSDKFGGKYRYTVSLEQHIRDEVRNIIAM